MKLALSHNDLGSKQESHKAKGQMFMSPGSKFTAVNVKGGCGANDFAQCIVDVQGCLFAYYRDAYDKNGLKGQKVKGLQSS